MHSRDHHIPTLELVALPLIHPCVGSLLFIGLDPTERHCPESMQDTVFKEIVDTSQCHPLIDINNFQHIRWCLSQWLSEACCNPIDLRSGVQLNSQAVHRHRGNLGHCLMIKMTLGEVINELNQINLAFQSDSKLGSCKIGATRQRPWFLLQWGLINKKQ